jgi:hypothetical protein
MTGLHNTTEVCVTLSDGTIITDRDWSSMSECIQVGYFGGKKTVRLLNYDAVFIEAEYKGLGAYSYVPEGCRVYQAIRSEALITVNERKDRILGRIIGIVRDGEVIEEQSLNGMLNRVEGLRK